MILLGNNELFMLNMFPYDPQELFFSLIYNFGVIELAKPKLLKSQILNQIGGLATLQIAELL